MPLKYSDFEMCLYEGYIRNRKQLLMELSLIEAADPIETDKEIIIHAYIHWENEFADHLYGSFAFVIKNQVTGELICVRDAFGIETFYYALTQEGEFCFASDIRDILENSSYVKCIDDEQLQLYMMFGYPVGEKTLFKGIKKLLPGHMLIYKNGELQKRKWVSFRYETDETKGIEEWGTQIDETINEILEEDKLNLDMDRCGAFLSGGVDSSYLLAASGIKKTYTIGFTGKYMNEMGQARKTAELFSTDHSEVAFSFDDVLNEVPDFVKCTELPLADSASLAVFMGCSYFEDDSDVICSGEGADEFFAGYKVHSRADVLGSENGPGYYGCDGVMEQDKAMEILRQDRAYPFHELLSSISEWPKDNLHRMLLADTTLWLEGDVLFGVCKSGRKNGKRIILPYSDWRMFQLGMEIPSEYLRYKDIGKYPLRCAAQKKLPEEIAFRKKAGFPNPIRGWFRNIDYRSKIEQVLFSTDSEMFYDQKILREYWDMYLSGDDLAFKVIFSAYILLVWYAEFFNEI